MNESDSFKSKITYGALLIEATEFLNNKTHVIWLQFRLFFFFFHWSLLLIASGSCLWEIKQSKKYFPIWFYQNFFILVPNFVNIHYSEDVVSRVKKLWIVILYNPESIHLIKFMFFVSTALNAAPVNLASIFSHWRSWTREENLNTSSKVLK